MIPKRSLIYCEVIREKLIIKTNNNAKFRIGHFKEESADEVEKAIRENYFDDRVEENNVDVAV